MRAKLVKQKWAVGDVFQIPLSDGSFSIAHVVGQESSILNSVTCAFFDYKVSASDTDSASTLPLSWNKAFSILFVTRDLLDRGRWKIVGRQEVQDDMKNKPYEKVGTSGFVGARVIGSANIEEFVNAYYALSPWDDWNDPTYLDKLLLDPSKKPGKLIFKKIT